MWWKHNLLCDFYVFLSEGIHKIYIAISLSLSLYIYIYIYKKPALADKSEGNFNKNIYPPVTVLGEFSGAKYLY